VSVCCDKIQNLLSTWLQSFQDVSGLFWHDLLDQKYYHLLGIEPGSFWIIGEGANAIPIRSHFMDMGQIFKIYNRIMFIINNITLENSRFCCSILTIGGMYM
jgi:hypothetical protein